MTPQELAAYGAIAKDLTVSALLLFALVAIVKGWVITRGRYNDLETRYEEMRQDRDRWRDLALSGTELAGRLTATTSELVRGRTRRGD